MLLFVGGQGAPSTDPGAEQAGARIFAAGRAFSEVITDVVQEIRQHGKRRMDPYRA